jgi:glucose-1-phosphatase
MNSTIKFVYFDFGGVLVQFNRFYDELSRLSGKDIEDVKMIYVKHDYPACRGDITPQEFFARLTDDLGVETNLEKLEEFFFDSFEPIAVAHELISVLQPKYALGLATNIWKNEFPKLARHLPRIQFDVIIKSSDIGEAKPDKAFFEYAQKQISCEPHEVLFIDDNRENINGAKAFGWQGIVFDTQNPEKSDAEIRLLLGL